MEPFCGIGPSRSREQPVRRRTTLPEALVIGTVIQLDGGMGKAGPNHIRVWNAHPVSMTQITAAHHGLVFKDIPPGGCGGVPGRV